MALTADELRALDKMKERQHFLILLMGTPGWKVVSEEHDRASAHAYQLMVTTDNAHQAAKHMGVYHVCKTMKEWPAEEIKRLATQIKNIETRQR